MKNRILITFSLLVSIAIKTNANPDEGKNIFISRCAACHNVNKVMTGPALGGIDQRRPIDWIIKFVHSSQSVVKSGDVYAVALFEKFNKVPMPDHPDLTPGNIKSVVEYIKAQSLLGNDKAPFVKPSVKKTYYAPLSIQNNYGFFTSYLIVVIILIMILLFAVHSNNFRRKMRGN